MEAIEEADAFVLPEMNEGTRYLYDNVYNTLACGNEVRLSGLDFDAFELDDIIELDDIYEKYLEVPEERAGSIRRSLWGLPPIAVVSSCVEGAVMALEAFR
jgi:hypothetical protein